MITWRAGEEDADPIVPLNPMSTAWKRHGYSRLPEPGPSLEERRRSELEKQKRLGYSVTIPERELFRYQEPGRSLLGDVIFFRDCRYLRLDSFLCWEEPAGLKLTAAEYEQVLKRVAEYMVSEGVPLILRDLRPPVTVEGQGVVEAIIPRIGCWWRVDRE